MTEEIYEVIGFGARNWDDIRRVDEIVLPGGETSGSILPGDSGGSAANTVAGLSKLGVKTAFIGAVGTDDIGRYLVNDLEKENTTPLVLEKDGKSGTCLVLVDPKGERAIYVFPEVNDEISINDISKEILDNVKSADYLCTATFACKNSYKSLETQLELAKIAERHAFSPGTLYTKGRILQEKRDIIEDIMDNTEILFLNEKEIKNLTGMGTFKIAASHLLENYSNLDIIAVTLGKDGCFLNTKNEGMLIPTYETKSIGLDTTGAGDSFATGFMLGKIYEKPLETCGKIGNYVASRVIQHTGAREGLPTGSDPAIQKLLAQKVA
ncbi:MAG: carbohydrate kinase family protein [Candidatus Aenigmarchaeota archaeon]|nr:carbohydrate kinase family protein [Candidatus Aenigmarchaeota archaeon]